MVQPVNQAELDGHSEQAIIELLYVKTANDVLGSALGQLQGALQATTTIMQTLTALQNMKNSLQVENRTVARPFPNTAADYIKFASANFGSSIKPTLDPGFDSSSITRLQQELQAELQALGPIVGTDAQNDPNGLYQQVQKVIDDISKSGPTRWVMDNFDQNSTKSASDQGKYQDDLTLAITASQSLSDAQKEQVQNYLFIFQEYYQSAGAMLTTLNSILKSITRNISSS